MKDTTKDKLLATLAVCGIVAAVFSILLWGCWTSDNGVRVSTSRAYNRDMTKVQQEQLVYPIEVTAKVEYDGSYVYSKSRVVEFCDMKATKKQMKNELKLVWKEMRKGCK